MNQVIGMHEAKTTLSKFVQRTGNGDAEAELVPLGEIAPAKVCIGLLWGRLNVPDDFDTQLPFDVVGGFEDDL